LSLERIGPHRKKEETLALILEENVRKKPAKPWISNRQIYVGSGTVLTCEHKTETTHRLKRLAKPDNWSAGRP
jgi:hypothetical protein